MENPKFVMEKTMKLYSRFVYEERPKLYEKLTLESQFDYCEMVKMGMVCS